jgi:hypothetical protein
VDGRRKEYVVLIDVFFSAVSFFVMDAMTGRMLRMLLLVLLMLLMRNL